ncbi:lipoprotein [Gammaproteobacteria bacterium]|nr:lipoprotein [Gammaproteobacteria bacterium]
MKIVRIIVCVFAGASLVGCGVKGPIINSIINIL